MSYGAECVLVVVEKVVIVVVSIGILVVRWKHLRFGWVDEDKLFVRIRESGKRQEWLSHH